MTREPSRPKSIDTENTDTANGRDTPPAGPHATPDLTDHGKTPGTGILPGDEEGADDATESPTG